MTIFVGYSDTSKGWRFWNHVTNRITESSDVIFDETTGYSSSNFQSAQTESISIPASLFLDPSPDPVPQIIPPSIEPMGVSTSFISIPALDDDSTDSMPDNPLLSADPIPTDDFPLSPILLDPYEFESFSPPTGNTKPIGSKGNTGPTSSDIAEPLNPKYRTLTDIYFAFAFHPATVDTPPSFANLVQTTDTYREPTTYKQATMSPQATLWKATMEREYNSLMENKTWILVPPPPGWNIIHCKWVYKIKYTSTRAIDKYKARLVAKGYSQIHGIDYEETFSMIQSVFYLLSLLFCACICANSTSGLPTSTTL